MVDVRYSRFDLWKGCVRKVYVRYSLLDLCKSCVSMVVVSRNIRTPEMYGHPRSKYFEIFGPPLKYLDRVRSACCSRVVNCTKNGRPRFVRSWDDTLLTRCHESGL